ncbi:MAG TPA: DciA family protein [Vicinamibacterales bacterium]
MGPRALGATLPKITKTVLEKRGRAYAALIAEWANIVGPSLAAETMPEKLTPSPGANTGGLLSVRVTGAAAAELQHMAPQIIERINTYLGARAVDRLKLIHAPLPNPARRPPRRLPPLPPGADRAIRKAVSAIEDPALREALERLGRSIAREDLAAESALAGHGVDDET